MGLVHAKGVVRTQRVSSRVAATCQSRRRCTKGSFVCRLTPAHFSGPWAYHGGKRRKVWKPLHVLFHDRVTRCRVETYQGVPGAKNIPVPFFLGESPQGNESTAKLKVPSRVWRPPGGPRFPRRSRSQRFGDTSYKQDRTVDCLWRPRASSFLCPPVLSRSLPTDGTRTGHQTSWPECFRALSRLLRLLRRTLFVHGTILGLSGVSAWTTGPILQGPRTMSCRVNAWSPHWTGRAVGHRPPATLGARAPRRS